MLDYNSLLIALSFCSAGLAFTFFVSWFVSRSDSVLMTWGIGVAFLFVSLLFYRNFVVQFSPFGGVLAFSGLLIGLTLFMGAGRQFRSGVLPMRMMVLIAAASIAAMATPMLLGYDGISYIVLNIAAAAIMFATGLDYWCWRKESPTLTTICLRPGSSEARLSMRTSSGSSRSSRPWISPMAMTEVSGGMLGGSGKRSIFFLAMGLAIGFLGMAGSLSHTGRGLGIEIPYFRVPAPNVNKSGQL